MVSNPAANLARTHKDCEGVEPVVYELLSHTDVRWEPVTGCDQADHDNGTDVEDELPGEQLPKHEADTFFSSHCHLRIGTGQKTLATQLICVKVLKYHARGRGSWQLLLAQELWERNGSQDTDDRDDDHDLHHCRALEDLPLVHEDEACRKKQGQEQSEDHDPLMREQSHHGRQCDTFVTIDQHLAHLQQSQVSISAAHLCRNGFICLELGAYDVLVPVPDVVTAALEEHVRVTVVNLVFVQILDREPHLLTGALQVGGIGSELEVVGHVDGEQERNHDRVGSDQKRRQQREPCTYQYCVPIAALEPFSVTSGRDCHVVSVTPCGS